MLFNSFFFEKSVCQLCGENIEGSIIAYNGRIPICKNLLILTIKSQTTGSKEKEMLIDIFRVLEHFV